METFFAFLLSWPFAIGLFVVSLLFEVNEKRFFTSVFAIGSLAIAYNIFHPTLEQVFLAAPVYVVLGMFWSIWRYRQTAAEVVQENLEASDAVKRDALSYIHPKRMVGKLVAWMLLWPMSLISSVAGDLISMAEAVVKKVLRAAYESIYRSAEKALGLTPSK